MQRTTWKTCLDGTLATTLSWISKVPDLTKWGKKYDIFLSSLNNSRQNLNPPARRKSSSMSRTFASNEFELLSPASSFAILVWWPFHLNYYESNEKELLAAGLTFWWEVVQAGTFSGSREATEEVDGWLDGCRVFGFGWLDGWRVGGWLDGCHQLWQITITWRNMIEIHFGIECVLASRWW